MLAVEHLNKSYRGRRVLENVGFDAAPGTITGFLGPNGAGKSTTLRLLAGLERPERGRALIDGRPLSQIDRPLQALGCLLDSQWYHPGRSARAHLRSLAANQHIGPERVEQVLEMVNMRAAAGRKTKTYSLGMRQRVGIAAAFLGDPANLIFDEPANGLDPAGIRWLRDLLHAEAARGKTILLSSHLMAETAQLVDHLVVIAGGRVLYRGTLGEFLAAMPTVVDVSSDHPAAEQFLASLPSGGLRRAATPGNWQITGLDPGWIAYQAAAAGIVLTRVTQSPQALEDAFLALMHDSGADRGPLTVGRDAGDAAGAGADGTRTPPPTRTGYGPAGAEHPRSQAGYGYGGDYANSPAGGYGTPAGYGDAAPCDGSYAAGGTDGGYPPRRADRGQARDDLGPQNGQRQEQQR